MDDLRKTGRYEQAFKYHEDINLPFVLFSPSLEARLTQLCSMIPEEVESVANFIRIQLDRVEPGAHTVLCGG